MPIIKIMEYGVFVCMMLGLFAYVWLLDGGIAVKYLTRSEKVHLLMPVPFFALALIMYLILLIVSAQ